MKPVRIKLKHWIPPPGRRLEKRGPFAHSDDFLGPGNDLRWLRTPPKEKRPNGWEKPPPIKWFCPNIRLDSERDSRCSYQFQEAQGPEEHVNSMEIQSSKGKG